MKEKKEQGAKPSKGFGKFFAFARQNVLGLSFVVLFAAVGIYALTHSSAATGNDLVVTSVTMSPTSPAVGQAATFSAVVKNQGTTPVPAGTVVGVGFKIDGTRVTWNTSNTAGLAAGASVTLTANAGTNGATWTVTSGPHTLTATADDTNLIPDELDEGNNSLNTTFTIGSTGNLYLTPTTTSVFVNDNFDVTLRFAPGTTVDGVQATLGYDATKLQFVSLDAAGSPFDTILGPQTGGSGTVNIAQGNLSGGVSTDALVVKVTFKALAGSGSGTITVTGNATKAGVYTNPTTTAATVNFSTPDTTAPTTAITAPTAGTSIFNTVNITASASDNVGVTKVELYINGQLKGTDTSSPYAFSIDTKSLANGATTLQTKAYDAAGNVGPSTAVSVTVKNWAEDINQDGLVNIQDFSLLASSFGKTGAAITTPRADINGDAKVDLLDFSMLAAKFGQ